MAQLQNENAPAYKDLSKEMKAYMDYICDTLLKQTTGILMSDKIEAEDETQIAWATQETISLNRYLNYAISKTGSIPQSWETALIRVLKRFIAVFWHTLKNI